MSFDVISNKMNSSPAYDLKVIFADTGNAIHTYSNLLRAESEILEKIIPKDDPEPVLTIHGASQPTFCDALKCISSRGRSLENVALAITLRAFGITFKMRRLCAYCEEFLLRNLNAHNVGEIYELSCLNDDRCIQYYCWRMFDSSWRQIFTNRYYYKYSSTTMMRYISRPIYHDIDEYLLWTAVYNWSLNLLQSEPDLIDARAVLEDFLPYIRFLAMKTKELNEVFKSNILTREECDAIVDALQTFDVTHLPPTISRETVPRREINRTKCISHISFFYCPKHTLLRKTKAGDTFYSEFTVTNDCFLTSILVPLDGFIKPLTGILEIFICSTRTSKSDTKDVQLLSPFLHIYPPIFIEKDCTTTLNFIITEANSSYVQPYASCNIGKVDKVMCREADEWKSFYINDILLYF